MENKKSFYAIIPADVRYDKSITPNAKLLYGEITALCNEKGFCWATNGYFAELYNVSKTSISKWISQLKARGYIAITIELKEGSKEILNRYIRIVKDPIEEKLNPPIEEKLKDNNTLINSTINNTYNKETFKECQKVYNDKLLLMYNQKDINVIVYKSSKQIACLNKLLKKFDTFDKCKSFFEAAYEDCWLKKEGFLPALILSQYEKIVAKTLVKPAMNDYESDWLKKNREALEARRKEETFNSYPEEEIYF